MSITTYVFVEKQEKYQYFWIEKSALTSAMHGDLRWRAMACAFYIFFFFLKSALSGAMFTH